LLADGTRSDSISCHGYTAHIKVKKIKRSVAVRGNQLTATANHMPYGITQCYLPPDSGDFSAFTPAEDGTRFSDPGGMQG